MLTIHDATTPEAIGAVRQLMRDFVAWHRVRHADYLHLVDAYFDKLAFEAELQGLPGKYQAPAGALLLATVVAQPVGCVAMRPLPEGRCEMKRMFVNPAFHGQGVGRALAEGLLARAQAAGHVAMRLDTGVLQKEAIGLYRALGFQDVAPYYEAPADMQGHLVFMERALVPRS